jgi:hypothetical protein
MTGSLHQICLIASPQASPVEDCMLEGEDMPSGNTGIYT